MTKIALIIGSGQNVANELAMLDKSRCDIIIGVNQAAIDYGPVDVHMSLHPKQYGPKKAAWFVSPVQDKNADEVYTRHWCNAVSSGSSGMFATHYAINRCDADYVILAGIGIDAIPHYYGGGNWRDAQRFQKAWTQMAPLMRGKVFSLGGWTQQLLNPNGEMPPTI